MITGCMFFPRPVGLYRELRAKILIENSTPNAPANRALDTCPEEDKDWYEAFLFWRDFEEMQQEWEEV